MMYTIALDKLNNKIDIFNIHYIIFIHVICIHIDNIDKY